jgi:hypothetical protein
MKKHIIFSGLILSLMALMSCNGTYDDWADPQQNAQEDAISVPGVTATAAKAIDLGQAGDSVQLFTLSTVSLPAGMTFEKARVVLTPKGEPKDETVTTLYTSNTGKIDSTTMQNTVIANFGKKVASREYSARVFADATKDGQSIFLDAGTITLNVTPAKTFIAYYLVGSLQGWSTTDKRFMFYPTNDDVFSYTSKWAGSYDLKIWNVDDFGNWDLAYGTAVNGDGSESGSLINKNAQAFQAPTKDEYYTLTINMQSNTYTWTKCENQSPAEYSKIGLIGEFNQWSSDFEMTQTAPHNWYVKFTQKATGPLKFRANGGWDVNWGTGMTIGKIYYGVGTNGGSNITLPAGNYEVFFNDITGNFAFVTVE